MNITIYITSSLHVIGRGRHARDHMVVGFTTTYAISAYHTKVVSSNPVQDRWGVLDTALCDEVCQWLVTGQWFSPVSSTSKTDRKAQRYSWNIVESGVKRHTPVIGKLIYEITYTIKIINTKNILFLAHLTQRVMWAITITWLPSYVVNFLKNLLLWKY
jgi:hypothetical protein